MDSALTKTEAIAWVRATRIFQGRKSPRKTIHVTGQATPTLFLFEHEQGRGTRFELYAEATPVCVGCIHRLRFVTADD